MLHILYRRIGLGGTDQGLGRLVSRLSNCVVTRQPEQIRRRQVPRYQPTAT
jgi:hypothetical protein